ncbi:MULTISPECIES: carbon-nitrogen hydrolase [unclassified Apibacter]|uniref:carbon-nitrogen hydrolase n=1 Tax=unclassified Apibacter TaxID=2630820 RepID=UPI00135DF32A|nr:MULTISPECIES: carbon-nitrogen hydrolase [unclassified Apibacter]MXP05557.1 acyltransferase [Apibacter sp. B3546]MXP12522.1 acyltransferase [Apibacter sp. B3239]
MAKVKIGLVQSSCSNNIENNIEKAIEGIKKAASQGAQIVCLQELFTSLYFCDVENYDNFKIAETIPGPTTDRLGKIAAELNVVIVASLFEKRAKGLYHNTTAIIDADGQYLGKYRKMHIPDDPAYYEKFYFTPGDLGYKVFQTKYAKIGVLICWDQWYPEASRITALLGAEILFYPTAIGWASTQDEDTNIEQYNAWQTIQRSHAIANGVHTVSVNRVGYEQDGAMKFWGGSFVSNPFGTILQQASHENEEVMVVKIETEQSDSYRVHWPFLRDRRIDSYFPITKRFIDED